MILKRLRVFCKLVVLLVVVAMTGYLILKTLKWRFNDKNKELAKNDKFETYDSI